MGQQQSYYSEAAKADLLAKKIRDLLLLNRPLVTLTPSDTLKDALQVTGPTRTGKWDFSFSKYIMRPDYSLVDVVDIITFIATSYTQLGMRPFKDNKDHILNVTCGELADFSACNPTLSIPADSTVADVLPLMRQSRTHRMVLVEPDGTIFHLVTQSNLVEFMLLNLDRLHPTPDATISELSFHGTSPIRSFDESKLTVEAFVSMQRGRITAMPVENRSGTMNGIITVRNVKVLTTDSFDDLFLTVRDFLKKHNVMGSYILGTHTMTLRDLLRSVVVNVYHHLFFVDDTGKASHVITLTDILDFIASNVAQRTVEAG
ncbi:hypothetical protein HK104_003071 [Borealophlyctis nickersoniae]|nr:hypothetical protein HK104_003071 [Borealophlyctis nickersoniae]